MKHQMKCKKNCWEPITIWAGTTIRWWAIISEFDFFGWIELLRFIFEWCSWYSNFSTPQFQISFMILHFPFLGEHFVCRLHLFCFKRMNSAFIHHHLVQKDSLVQKHSRVLIRYFWVLYRDKVGWVKGEGKTCKSTIAICNVAI